MHNAFTEYANCQKKTHTEETLRGSLIDWVGGECSPPGSQSQENNSPNLTLLVAQYSIYTGDSVTHPLACSFELQSYELARLATECDEYIRIFEYF